MNILLALVPISVILLALAIWTFIWAVKRGQFDDMDTPALDILTEEANTPASKQASSVIVPPEVEK